MQELPLKRTPLVAQVEERHGGKRIDQIIREALEATNGNAAAAARLVGVDRATFWFWKIRLRIETRTETYVS